MLKKHIILLIFLLLVTLSPVRAQEINIDGIIIMDMPRAVVTIPPGINIRPDASTQNPALFTTQTTTTYTILSESPDDGNRGLWYQIADEQGTPIGWVASFAAGVTRTEEIIPTQLTPDEIQQWLIENPALPPSTTRITQDGNIFAFEDEQIAAVWLGETLQTGKWFTPEQLISCEIPALSAPVSGQGEIRIPKNQIVTLSTWLPPEIGNHFTALTQSPLEALIVCQPVTDLRDNSTQSEWVLQSPEGDIITRSRHGLWLQNHPPENYTATLTRSFSESEFPYVIFQDETGTPLPVVEGIVPVRNTANRQQIDYIFEGKRLASYDIATGVFMDVLAGLPAHPSIYQGFGEIVQGQSAVFVYGYEPVNLGKWGYQILPAHLVAEIQIFREQTIPIILSNTEHYAALAQQKPGPPYNIQDFDWSYENVESLYQNWSFPDYVNTLIPAPGTVETTIGRLHDIITKGVYANGIWISRNEEIRLVNILVLQNYLAESGIQRTPEQIVQHLLGGIAADDTLSTAQRFMLLSGIDTATTTINIDVSGDILLTTSESYRISMDKTGIWASMRYDTPQHMRAMLIHELGGHAPEFWGDILPCARTTNGHSIRERIEPMRYITGLNDLLVTNPDPNPIALQEDYETVAASVMIFTRFRDYSAPGTCQH